jgi:hypothetical protein
LKVSVVCGPVSKAVYLLRELLVEQAAHLTVAKKQKRDQGPTIPFKGTPPMTKLPPTWPYLLKILPPPSSAKLDPSPLTYGLFEGDISDPNYGIYYLYCKSGTAISILYSLFHKNLL